MTGQWDQLSTPEANAEENYLSVSPSQAPLLTWPKRKGMTTILEGLIIWWKSQCKDSRNIEFARI